MPRDDDLLSDILAAAHKIAGRMTGVDRGAFMADDVVQDAVIRQLIIIGEAGRSPSPEYKAAHTEIPWSRIGRMRNILVHAYQFVSLRIVWDTATSDVPDLVRHLNAPQDDASGGA